MEHYVYSALPDLHFRLLTILPRSSHGSEIHCSLKVHSLVQSPAYTCLSYTWGVSSLINEIYIDGRIAPVTYNLFRALQDLSPAVEHTIWVDALCINQMNIQERNKQVQIMRDIFGRAQRVMAWIGDNRLLQGEERWEQGACEFLTSLAAVAVNQVPFPMGQRPKRVQTAPLQMMPTQTMPIQAAPPDTRRQTLQLYQKHSSQTMPAWMAQAQTLPTHMPVQSPPGPYLPVQTPAIQHPSVRSLPDQKPQDPPRHRLVQTAMAPRFHAAPLFVKESLIPYYKPVPSKAFVTPILETDWNTRAWVLQEAALAQELILYWRGGEEIQWETFVAALKNMQQSRSTPSSHISSFLVKDDIRRRVKSRIQPEADRAKRQKVTRSTFRPITWPHALSVAAGLKSTNPRDKIYSVIGLLDPSDAGEFPAKYEWSVRDLYIDFARYMLYKFGPEYLEHVDHNRAVSEAMDLPAELRQLPSWTPDLIAKSCNEHHLLKKWSQRDIQSDILDIGMASPIFSPETTPNTTAEEPAQKRHPVSEDCETGEMTVTFRGRATDSITEIGAVNNMHEARGENSAPGQGFIEALRDWIGTILPHGRRAVQDLRRLMVQEISGAMSEPEAKELNAGWDSMVNAVLIANGQQLPDYLESNTVAGRLLPRHRASSKATELTVKTLLRKLDIRTQTEFANWNRGTLERRLAITEKGHVGFVPSDTRVGDTVVALPGLEVDGKVVEHPRMHRFVMRGEADSWRLIGSCMLEKDDWEFRRDELETFEIR